MNNIFTRYKYHHRVLREIACENDGWFSSKRNKGEGMSSLPSNEYLSKKFNVSVELIIEITSELKKIECITSVLGINGCGYFTGDKSQKYIDTRFFKHKRSEYLKNLIIPNIKDFLLIITSVIAISTFLLKADNKEKYFKLIESEIIEVKLKQKSLELELSKIKTTLKDTLSKTSEIKNTEI